MDDHIWPDRTGPRTKRELGARQAGDVTFDGQREEHKGSDISPEGQASVTAPEGAVATDGPTQMAPDEPPTQWHPDQHGVPGDHFREGHHRSATAPTRKGDSKDPYAHAPIPGPNHIIPEGGLELPPRVQP